MASWTDNNRIPQFNPYVEQQPVSQMVQIGEQKQNQYDQGIQKIQGQIDNVAGMDVVRDVDKQYLQSKLNDLGNNLKTVAAADFSNFQLVNSTGGMINQIGKDPNIQNAVYSTANHRSQLAAMNTARADGTLAPENELDYQKQFSAYVNSGKVGDVFNGKYTPFIDVNKKLVDAAKSVGIDGSTLQQLYQTDSNGKPLTDKNGLPMFNPVMVEKHLKGKDPAKLLAAFQNSLTPADYNQLAMTGRYINGSLTPEQLAQKVSNNYSQNIDYTAGKLADVSLQLANAKNSNDYNSIQSLSNQKDYFSTLKSKPSRRPIVAV